jgi:hypothetical protein
MFLRVQVKTYIVYIIYMYATQQDAPHRNEVCVDFIEKLVEGSCEHGNEPSRSLNAGQFLSGCTTGGLSRRAQLVTIDAEDDS